MEIKFPTHCPSCSTVLNVVQLSCTTCQTLVSGSYLLPVFMQLSPKEQEFVLHFFLASGSLKEMALQYGISYPTMRNQLDDLIAHIQQIQSSYE